MSDTEKLVTRLLQLGYPELAQVAKWTDDATRAELERLLHLSYISIPIPKFLRRRR